VRVEWAEIVAFGPFADQRLELAPGMTVIYGLNEAGKSSWHAAIYAALCGLPRGRGAPTREVRKFADLHQPWDGTRWAVRAMLRLADGRSIEIHQDLAGRVDCSAVDITTGRDVSNEIMDGTPDASRWLGLDRRSFLGTACVGQTDLLAVLDDPDALQEQLQRAAATAGTDATAAAAIQRLEDFKAEHVGLDRANSTRPLRRAINQIESAQDGLRRASEAHEEFADESAHAERAIKKAVELDRHARAARARLARLELNDATSRLRRAQELRSELGDNRPPDVTDLRRTVTEARAAIQAWEQQPADVATEGRTVAELEERLEALPTMPDDDTAPDAVVSSAWHAYELARDALQRHPPLPPPPQPPQTGGLDRTQLYEAIRVLEQSEPSVPTDAAQRLDAARARVQHVPGGTSFIALIALGGIAAAIGAALAFTGSVPPGVAGLLLGGAMVVTSLVFRSRRRTSALESLRAAESELGEQRFALDRIRKEKEAVRNRLAGAALPDEPDALREVLSRMERTEAEAATYASRATELDQLRAEREEAERTLAHTLIARGVAVDPHAVEAGYRTYVDACDENAAVADQAHEREGLERLLEQRRPLERTAEEVRQQRDAAHQALRSAAVAHGLEGTDDTALGSALAAWLEHADAELVAVEKSAKEWSELDGLLADKTVEEVEADVQRLEATWNAMSGQVDDQELAMVDAEEADPHASVERLGHDASMARSDADRMSGKVKQMASQLPSVPEAEERLAAAERELARVRRLEDTLSHTLGFLWEAQERVHRDIAPVLARTIRSWLPTITEGRYTDAAVDPATLAVRVRTAAGAWRDARVLSEGTREQVYLLLRVALAEHLTTRDEVSPLILDDVTVQCDTVRTQRILQVLHEVSEARQVILFTQEDDVQRWGAEELGHEVDSLISLS
jgi:DNA repair protein SbcC/Rad50